MSGKGGADEPGGSGGSSEKLDQFDLIENESVKEPVEQIPKSSEGIYQPPHEGSSDDVSQDDVVHPDITVDVNSGGEENATLEEKDKLSEGDDDYYQEFNEMFHDVVITPVVTPDRQANMRTYTRKSSRKTSQPVKLTKLDSPKRILVFSETGKGGINLRDLRRVAASHDFTWNDEEMEHMIQFFDSNEDGKLSLEDFTKIAELCNMRQGPAITEPASVA
ncbi:calmodulin-related protein [Artemisia annua]|uniref:Calmodulin-related protein n=1 Tax=Artemisia annua TaxID=35608 RepID=A0A2U1PMU4_ARTAN|nr:calmodulin-related protein [Artemisia annua]